MIDFTQASDYQLQFICNKEPCETSIKLEAAAELQRRYERRMNTYKVRLAKNTVNRTPRARL